MRPNLVDAVARRIWIASAKDPEWAAGYWDKFLEETRQHYKRLAVAALDAADSLTAPKE